MKNAIHNIVQYHMLWPTDYLAPQDLPMKMEFRPKWATAIHGNNKPAKRKQKRRESTASSCY